MKKRKYILRSSYQLKWERNSLQLSRYTVMGKKTKQEVEKIFLNTQLHVFKYIITSLFLWTTMFSESALEVSNSYVDWNQTHDVIAHTTKYSRYHMEVCVLLPAEDQFFLMLLQEISLHIACPFKSVHSRKLQ